MYDENQKVKMKWSTSNRKWFECKGYNFSNYHDEFDVYAKDLSEKSSAKIEVTCDYCGEKYTTQIDSINKGRKVICKDACQKCAGLKLSDVSRKRRAHKYFSKLRESLDRLGYTLISCEDEYTDLHMKIKYICQKHGIKEVNIDNAIRGCECIDCSYEKRFNNIRLNADYVENFINSINNNILLNKDEYKNCITNNLNILCKCGKVYSTSFYNYSRHNVRRCPSCSAKESVGEEAIRNFLVNNNIRFEQEKRFNECVDIKPLPFDFYLADYNMCIEFDGAHHYKQLDGFGNYDLTHKHDIIKNNYCKANNIDIVRIPYYDFKNINNILTNKLKI